MNKVSNSSLAYILINSGCATVNAYLTPTYFTISGVIGLTVGLGMGLKRRADALIIDYNEKAVNEAINQSARAAEVANQMTENFQSQAKDRLTKIGNSSVGKTTLHYTQRIVETTKPILNKIYRFSLPLFKLYVRFSGYGATIDKAASYVMKFEEQRLAVIHRLNPVPGIKGTILSIASLSAQVGYLTFPLLSKLWILSGFPAGYACGLYLMQNSKWKWLKSESYENTMKTITL